MSLGDEGYIPEESITQREEILYKASQIPYLVSACSSAEMAKDLACKLIDSGFPVIVEPLNGLPEGSCWLVFTDCDVGPMQVEENE